MSERRFPRDARDVGPGPVLAVVGLLAFLAVAGVALHGAQTAVSARVRRDDAARPKAYSRLPPEPRLQAHPAFDLARLRREEDERLDGWGWTDRKAGLARVPVERAIELLAEPQDARRNP